MANEAQPLTRPSRVVWMWLGLLVPPFAWFVHLNAGYILAGYACSRDMSWILHAATVAALAVGGVGIFAGWRIWRDLRKVGDGSVAAGRARFFAISGFAMSAFFMAAIALQGLTNFFMDPCGAP